MAIEETRLLRERFVATQNAARLSLAGIPVGGVLAMGLEIRLVVTDLNMPNLDGTALALVLKRLQREVPNLAMTGLGSGPTPGSTPTDGFANAKLQKPFTTDSLLAAVQGLLQAGVK